MLNCIECRIACPINHCMATWIPLHSRLKQGQTHGLDASMDECISPEIDVGGQPGSDTRLHRLHKRAAYCRSSHTSRYDQAVLLRASGIFRRRRASLIWLVELLEQLIFQQVRLIGGRTRGRALVQLYASRCKRFAVLALFNS